MNPDQKIYIRLRQRIKVAPNQHVVLKDICQFIVHPDLERRVAMLPIHQMHPGEQRYVVIDLLYVIQVIRQFDGQLEIDSLGEDQVILHLETPRKLPPFILVVFVWTLLFIGSGLTIMNFHEDVGMSDVHQRLYTILTGEEQEHPLLLQIPYSIGIGAGMILFFNHFFKKRLSKEPSPLELEVHQYE